MTNLEKVIKAVDICKDVTGCQKCPYYEKKEKLMGCMDKKFGKNRMLEEVAYYLKKYFAIKNAAKETK